MEKSADKTIDKLIDRIDVLENALKEIGTISAEMYKAKWKDTQTINEIITKALWPV